MSRSILHQPLLNTANSSVFTTSTVLLGSPLGGRCRQRTTNAAAYPERAASAEVVVAFAEVAKVAGTGTGLVAYSDLAAVAAPRIDSAAFQIGSAAVDVFAYRTAAGSAAFQTAVGSAACRIAH